MNISPYVFAPFARHLSNFHGAALFFELPFVASPLVDLSSSNPSVPANYAFLFVTPEDVPKENHGSLTIASDSGQVRKLQQSLRS
jgi:hypothetical protein